VADADGRDLIVRTEGDERSVPECIADMLRDWILQGDIGPGERINVRKLEGRLGVSHIPIREAIRLLEAEGLVVNAPNKGAIATHVSLQELDEIYDLRRIIEPAVARRAIPRMTKADLEALTTGIKQVHDAEHAEDESFSRVHWDFHWHILQPGATDEIKRVLFQLWRTADRYIRLTRVENLDAAHEQHDQLYDACLLANATDVADIVEQHLFLTGNAIRSRYHEIDQRASLPATQPTE
jgi:DNA-binding GntR family transcriptional regulator